MAQTIDQKIDAINSPDAQAKSTLKRISKELSELKDRDSTNDKMEWVADKLTSQLFNELKQDKYKDVVDAIYKEAKKYSNKNKDWDIDELVSFLSPLTLNSQGLNHGKLEDDSWKLDYIGLDSRAFAINTMKAKITSINNGLKTDLLPSDLQAHVKAMNNINGLLKLNTLNQIQRTNLLKIANFLNMDLTQYNGNDTLRMNAMLWKPGQGYLNSYSYANADKWELEKWLMKLENQVNAYKNADKISNQASIESGRVMGWKTLIDGEIKRRNLSETQKKAIKSYLKSCDVSEWRKAFKKMVEKGWPRNSVKDLYTAEKWKECYTEQNNRLKFYYLDTASANNSHTMLKELYTHNTSLFVTKNGLLSVKDGIANDTNFSSFCDAWWFMDLESTADLINDCQNKVRKSNENIVQKALKRTDIDWSVWRDDNKKVEMADKLYIKWLNKADKIYYIDLIMNGRMKGTPTQTTPENKNYDESLLVTRDELTTPKDAIKALERWSLMNNTLAKNMASLLRANKIKDVQQILVNARVLTATYKNSKNETINSVDWSYGPRTKTALANYINKLVKGDIK